jgi:hypothetical protein
LLLFLEKEENIALEKIDNVAIGIFHFQQKEAKDIMLRRNLFYNNQ